MIRSMTGFGQGSAEAPGLRVTVALRGLNNRFADVRLKLPAEMAAWEAELRKRCQEVVRRGRLEVSVTLERTEGADASIRLNRAQIDAIVAAAKKLEHDYGLRGGLDVATLLSLPGVLQSPGSPAAPGEVERKALSSALDVALRAFDGERAREGEALREDLLGRVGAMLSLTERLRERAAEAPDQVRERLVQRVTSLQGEVEIDPARLAQEAALLADRADVTEELVRLAGHLEHMRALLSEPDGDPVGKRLDFLVQEIQREANTVGSKSAHLELSRVVLALKTELERVREQAQNLE